MTTVVMPQLGESVMEGTVVRWIARPGQKVERDEPLVEIATDKANTEIPSPSSGVLVEQLAKEGAVVTVGGPLARLGEAATGAPAAAPQAPAKPSPPPASAPAPPAKAAPGAEADGARAPPGGRNVAEEHGLDLSKVTSPHVPCTAEVDMTNLARLRGEWKRSKETGGKAPSFLVGICRATVQALAEFPRLNAVVQDESIILRKDVNLGVAVETEKGLLVPVIRKANELSVLGLARAIDDLAARSRTGKVTADELSGGSFTVSNPGLQGNLFGAAIINQPQVGILRMGEIVKRAVVRELNGEDAIVVRQMMYLTLSYDHRVIDGVTGNGFLHRVRELIEEAKFEL